MAEEAAADAVQVGLVRDELRRGTDIGESRSRQALQEACGIGAGDLEKVLTALRLDGEATEEAPDEWRLVEEHDGEERDEPGAGAEADVEEPELTLAEAEERSELPGRPRSARPPVEDVRVSLPMGVAKTLDPDDLGSIVKAGIGEAESKSAAFVFEVTR